MISISYRYLLTGKVQCGQAFSLKGNVQSKQAFSLTGNVLCNATTKVINYDYYEGEYTVTPTRETQTLDTKDLILTDNVTVNPIPPEYGLITWNGSFLRVS